ncbi:MAG TPA: phospholipase D-like domain-containing protein [Steroidobacteraceae bacterium]|nr:phospholipase D-like domain-containing protein [Steroidobacteraceae bacterium]
MRFLPARAGRKRLDYRMHNKLFVVDGAIAVFGGRNIGDQYFQVDPESQFADEDVFAIGAAVDELARTFDRYWNSELAVPAQALAHARHALRLQVPGTWHTLPEKAEAAGANFTDKLHAGEPLAGILSGAAALVWAHAEVACDSPDKRRVAEAIRLGSLMYEPVANAIGQTQSELTLVTPYLVPTAGELKLLEDRLIQHRRVRILTNSLESAPDLAAQAGYTHYRVPLLRQGAELFEVRARLDSVRGSGQSRKISRYGNYALHAKLLVFDRSSVYVGSMNFDQRSIWLNTWSTADAGRPVSPWNRLAAPGRDSRCACCRCCRWTASYERAGRLPVRASGSSGAVTDECPSSRGRPDRVVSGLRR